MISRLNLYQYSVTYYQHASVAELHFIVLVDEMILLVVFWKNPSGNSDHKYWAMAI